MQHPGESPGNVDSLGLAPAAPAVPHFAFRRQQTDFSAIDAEVHDLGGEVTEGTAGDR